MNDPEAYETALAGQLDQLDGWTAAPSTHAEEKPGTISVAWQGTDYDQAVAGYENPASSIASGGKADSRFRARFFTERQAARGVFAGLLKAVLRACATLSNEREGEFWTLTNYNPRDEDAEAENPCRGIDFFINVGTLVEA